MTTTRTRIVKQAPTLQIDGDNDLRMEGKIERRIVWNLIEQLAAVGFVVVAVDDSEERVTCADAMAVMELVFNLDEARLIVKKKGSREHEIKLVLGNGETVISDWIYSTGDRDKFNAFMTAFNAEDNW